MGGRSRLDLLNWGPEKSHLGSFESDRVIQTGQTLIFISPVISVISVGSLAFDVLQ